MNEFGEAMRGWRKFRGLSQLKLSLSANISSKHVSFLETGRSQPSREMIIQLSNSLDIPLAERNILLKAAGYADAYSRMSIDQNEMLAVRSALELMLDSHAPYPALVLDWRWNIKMANVGFQKISNIVRNAQPNFPDTCNIVELIFDPDGYRPYIENWEEVASVLIGRIQREKRVRRDDQLTLLEDIKKYPNLPSVWSSHDLEDKSQPMIPVMIRVGDIRLRLFSALTSFGTAIDITAQELFIEQYFPIDEGTKDFFSV